MKKKKVSKFVCDIKPAIETKESRLSVDFGIPAFWHNHRRMVIYGGDLVASRNFL